MEYTKEQQKIISTAIDILEKNKKTYNITYMIIEAGPGSGKTFTLTEMAKYLNGVGISLVFNAANAKEAKNKYPHNTYISTTHSFALKKIRQYYGDVEIKNGNYNTRDLMNIMGLNYNDAYNVLSLYNRFCNSSRKLEDYVDFISTNYGSRHISVMQNFYLKIRNQEIKMDHSFYLKEFQLLLLEGKIEWQQIPDFLFLDEAQDTNSVTSSIFENIPALLKVLVGDPYQQIYSFRGAKNFIKDIKNRFDKNNIEYKELPLKVSFRFPPEIANRANLIIELFKDNAFVTGIGKGVDKIQSRAIIARTNAVLLEEGVELLKKGINEFKAIRDVKSIVTMPLAIIKQLLPSYQTKVDEIVNKFGLNLKQAIYIVNDISEFGKIRNVETIKNILREKDDKENYTAFNIVHKIDTSSLLEVIEVFLNNQNLDNNLVSHHMTTCHTAKGLEFDEIKICNDFNITSILFQYYLGKTKKTPSLKTKFDFAKNAEKYYDMFIEDFKNNRLFNPQLAEELNLYYVAITRGKDFRYVNDKSDIANIYNKNDFIKKAIISVVGDKGLKQISNKMNLEIERPLIL